jgi:hypothetical protein
MSNIVELIYLIERCQLEHVSNAKQRSFGGMKRRMHASTSSLSSVMLSMPILPAYAMV